MMKNIGVIGGSKCTREICALAYRVGYLIAKKNGVLISGGLGGVMECASHGAKDAGGITVGILPYGKKEANKYIDIAIPTYYGLARNHLIVRASDALIAIDGFVGTLSEISFALNENKTVVSLHSWDIDERKITKGNYIKVENPENAVNLVFESL